MANKTMLRICHLLNQCDGCERKKNTQEKSKEEKIKACAGCLYFQELAELRPFIDDVKPDKCKRILAKGEDMTTSEIAYLLKQCVKKKDIQEALGMSGEQFRELLHALGLARAKSKAAVG